MPSVAPAPYLAPFFTPITEYLIPLTGIKPTYLFPQLMRAYLEIEGLKSPGLIHCVFDRDDTPSYALKLDTLMMMSVFRRKTTLFEDFDVLSFDVMPAFEKDATLIIDGKYSEISKEAKECIISRGDEYYDTDRQTQVLHKSRDPFPNDKQRETVLKFWTNKMGEIIPEGQELWPKPYETKLKLKGMLEELANLQNRNQKFQHARR